MTIVTIDGNIGSGKTSILTYLHKLHKMSIDLEPVESWNKYLEKMYDGKNDVFNFQVRIWMDRCWIQEKTDKNIILIERSPYFIKNSFIQIAFNKGLINQLEYDKLLQLHKKTDNLWLCNTYIYLRSNPENCFQRIKKRARASEENITEEYIKDLHDIHEESYKKAKENKMKIIMIDVDNKNISEIADEIMQYINTQCNNKKTN